jgi:hypothetical protein
MVRWCSNALKTAARPRMRYPPAIAITPAGSHMYRAAASVITIILIALCAYFIKGSSHFDSGKLLVVGLMLVVASWLMWDAWASWLLPQRAHQDQLHYANGLWTLRKDRGQNQQTPDTQGAHGTLRLHLDLQSYLLVSFQTNLPPTSPLQSALARFFPTTTQWFHLEARHFHPAATTAPSWLALRRAVHASQAPLTQEQAA